jgi:lactoylglutathione lyase
MPCDGDLSLVQVLSSEPLQTENTRASHSFVTRANKLFPMLSVSDLSRSLAFYRDLLSGVVSYRFPEQGEPAFVVVTVGESSEIGLGALSSDGAALHGEPLRPASGHRIELCVYVDDVDATVQAARAAGFAIVLEPRAQPWGERIAYLRDPDGNLIMLAH